MDFVNKPPVKPSLSEINNFPSGIGYQQIALYERYLPTAFDGSLTLLEKVNKVIHEMNRVGDLSNKMLETWKKILEWVLNDGLEGAIIDRLEEWLENGTIEQIINEQVFGWLLENKQPTNPDFRKKIFQEFPMRFPDYDTLVGNLNLKNLYPSAFDIDWDNNEIFIVFLGALEPSGVYTDRLVAVFDIRDASYKTAFWCGVAGGEGIVVRTVGGTRELYMQSGGGNLGVYLINELPSPRSKLLPSREIYCNVHWTFGWDGKYWLITQAGSEIGYKDARETHAYYDNNFQRQGFVTIDQNEWGYQNSAHYDTRTKLQTMAIGNGKIYGGIGAYYAKGTTNTRGYIGTRVWSNVGDPIGGGLMDSEKVVKKFNDMGYDADILENEGMHVNRKTGKVYTLWVAKRPDHADARYGGILIMEEEATGRDAIDFSDCAVTPPGTSKKREFQPLSYRKPDGTPVMEDDLTGQPLDSMVKIITHMFDRSREKFAFYSTTTPVAWFDGVNIGGARYVEIINLNNTYFLVNVSGYENRQQLQYFVTRNHSNGHCELIDVTPQGFVSLYMQLGSGKTIYDLNRGLYEIPLNKTTHTYLPESFPNGDVLCLVDVRGSTTRERIEIFIPSSGRMFVGAKHPDGNTNPREI